MRSTALPKIDKRSSVPRHVQAKTILADAIRTGVFQPGAKLPSTSELGAWIDVSLVTAHKAIQSLVREGWLRRERGRGTFVRVDFEAAVASTPTLRVALVLPPDIDLGNYYHAGLMAGINRGAENNGPATQLLIQRSQDFSDLENCDADGLICFHPHRHDFERLEAVATRRPLMILGASLKETTLPCVDSENFEGARLAVRHLIDQGHRRIAIVNGPLTATNCQDRFDGYVAELTERGLPVRPEFIMNADSAKSAPQAMERLARLLPRDDRPTAVFACGYYLALDTMKVVRELGMQIPDDVSLIGFDDSKSASLLNPPLTVVKQPLEDMGALAYVRVIQLTKGLEFAPETVRLSTSLLCRESTSRPQGRLEQVNR